MSNAEVRPKNVKQKNSSNLVVDNTNNGCKHPSPLGEGQG
jgi:hypothetical protein